MEFKSRVDLPRIFTERGYRVGAEIGVCKGEFAAHILRNWDGFLFLIDSWQGEEGAANHRIAKQTLRESSKDSSGCWRYHGRRMSSIDAANSWVRTLDFVYIDADHSYDSVKADIEAWWPRVRPGGIIAGHDWVLDGWHIDGEPFVAHENRPQDSGCSEYGVRGAVCDLQRSGNILHGLQMFITPPENDDGWQSFMFFKPE